MSYDKDKVDEVQLALLYLNSFAELGVVRAWKSLNWDISDRLFEKGLITDPKHKQKTISFTEEGLLLAEALFQKHFGS